MMDHSISPRAFVSTLMRYSDLIRRLVIRDFTAKYRGSILGVLWAVLTPLVMVAVFVFVFGVVFQSRWGVETPETSNFAVTFLVGMLVHGIFAEALGRAPGAIVAHPAYVKKVVFPLEILPVIIVLNAILTAAIGLAIVLVIHVLTTGSLAPTLMLLPLLLVPFVLMVLGLVYFFSAIGVYIRDLQQIISLVTLASLFMTPIFYPISAVPEGYRTLLYLNPLTFVVEQSRGVALRGESLAWTGLALYFMASCCVAWLGYAWFQKTRKGFADVL